MNEKLNRGLGPEIKYNYFREAADPTESDELNDRSLADEPIDYTEYISPVALVGEYPFDVILEGLRNQFSNYIGTEDTTDYVDIFYKQYSDSKKLAYEQDFPEDYLSAVEKYLDNFLAVIQELFSTKLAITLEELDGSAPTSDSIEMSIRKLYQFFILDAKKNFKTVITTAVVKNINPTLGDREFYREVRKSLEQFSPIILTIRPHDFLRICKQQDIIDMFDQGTVSGNFLRKYSPRLYRNEDFECEIITNITSVLEYRQELISTTKEGINNATTEQQD